MNEPLVIRVDNRLYNLFGNSSQENKNLSLKHPFNSIAKQGQVPEEPSAEVGRHNGLNGPLNGASVSETLTTGRASWEYMCRIGESSADRSVLNIIREYDDKKRTNQLRNCITELTERINGGEDEAAVRRIVQTIRRSKEKQLDRH